MAFTPESTVYRGVEGTGAAQIFGREGNPMRAYFERKGDIERKRAIKAETEKLQKQQRDKKLWELVNVDPKAAFEPFNQQVIDAADAHRKSIVEYFEKGGNPDDVSFQRQVKRGWDQVNEKAARSNYIKNEIQKTSDMIAKNPYLNSEYYFGKINDIYLNPDGTAKNLDDINVDNIRNIYITDPLGFDENKYQKDFMEGLNENMASYVTQTAKNNGILTQDVETKWKGNLYTADPTSAIGVKVDQNGKPILNITPEFIQTYTNSENAKRYFEAVAQNEGKTIDQVIRERIGVTGGGLKTDVKPSFSRNNNIPEWMYDRNNPGLKPDEVQTASRVFEHIKNINNALFDDNGNRTEIARPQAREALGHLVKSGLKIGNATVIGADIVAGTYDAGKTSILGKQIDNSPNDRVVLKVRDGKGIDRLIDIDVTDEGSAATLWNMFRDAGYMGKKNIDFDAAANKLNINPRTLYEGREYTAVKQKEEADKIQAWSQGNETGDLTQKSINGQNIKSVVLDKSWTGTFRGYKFKLENGEEVEVSKDDRAALRKIYNSKPIQKQEASNDTEETVSVRHPDGRTGRIPKSKLASALKAGFKEIK